MTPTRLALTCFLATLLAGYSHAEETVFVGCCDASAAVVVSEDKFIVADDEENFLRVYNRTGGKPLLTFDLGPHLHQKKKSDEADLEAATMIEDLVFWLGSHGRNSKAKNSPMRQKLVATKVDTRGNSLEILPVGEPYAHLLDDLIADERLQRFGLEAASKLAPKAPGGLNIEGMTATPEGHLLIGFRNPVPDGKALIVPLLNPRELFEGKRARFGDPLLLDLGGNGVRSLGYRNGHYLIIAGHFDQGGASRMFSWKGPSEAPTALPGVKFRGLNPEALAFTKADGDDEYLVLSDDGTQIIDEQECKKLKDPERKRFRGVIVKVPTS